MSDADSLKREIFEKIEAFYNLEHKKQPFIPGQTKIHYAGRVYDQQEMMAMVDAVLEFWLTMGRYAEEFEEELGKFLGVSDAVFVNSGSSANLLAVATLCSRELKGHLEMGDEVITPAVTFPTTVAPLIQNGLIPLFVDCELGTYNLDVSALEEAISETTRAIFVPHTLGNPCEMDKIMELAEKRGLFVIEDACDALGSRFDDKHVGTFGHLGTLSFYPAHHITTGEGGAVITNDKKLAKIARSIRDWGRACWCKYNTTDPNGACGRRFEWRIPGLPDTYDHRYLYTNIGYNLRPTDIQAALGTVQLAKLPGFIKKRKRNFQRLFEELKPHEDHLILPRWSERADVSWFAFPITVRPEAPFSRQELVCWLEDARIETRLLFAGNILKQPGYRDMKCRLVGRLENSDLVMRNSFFIGVYPGLDEVRINYVLEKFEEFFDGNWETGKLGLDSPIYQSTNLPAYQSTRLSVIMPAYNERDTILTALERVKAVEIEKEIIIVDNCSTDGTRELLQQINDDDIPSTALRRSSGQGSGHCRIIFQPQNFGKGTSIRTAIPYCTGDYTIIQDADLEYDPQDWHKLVDLALEKDLDAVYGSRVLGGPKAIYTHYYWGVSFLTFLINLLFGANLTDAATACKMVRTSVLKELKLTCAGFDLDFELTDKLCKNGYQIVEVPISYQPRSFEEGKKIRGKDGLKALFTILRDRFWA